MTGLIARIALRYIAGALVAKGLLTADDAIAIKTDPDLVELVTAGLGIAIGVGTEWFYALARKLGWER